jgi:aldehyde:ferredoxin oxidoreductase
VLTRKGMTLGKEAFAAMRREFYQLRGWDPDTGVQPPDTLDRLDLPGRADQSLLR